MNQPRESAATLLRLAAALLGLALPCAAQTPLWLRQFGTIWPDVHTFDPVGDPSGAACDGFGGVFVCSSTEGALGGPPAGGDDAWLARLDGHGNTKWIVQQGDYYRDEYTAVASDGAGGAFACGLFNNPEYSPSDAVVAHFDGTGALLWRHLYSNGSGKTDGAVGLASDGAGGVFVAGFTYGALFGPSSGFADAWALRFDASGALLWATQFGSAGADLDTRVAFDPVGGLYLGGSTTGAVVGVNQGSQDVWLARLDIDGRLDWLRQYGSTGYERLTAVVATEDGAFLAGYAQGNFAGPGQGGYDAWVLSVDASGARRWSRQIGLERRDEALTACADGHGGVFVAGTTTGNLWKPSKGKRDAWVARYDALGNFLWSDQLGSPQFEATSACTVDGEGNLFLFGWTTGKLGAQHKGGEDAWVARYVLD